MLSDELKKEIIDLSKEYDQLKGFVTCEFGLNKNLIEEFDVFVKDNTDIEHGKWVLIECDTCVSYHGEDYIHASIESFKTVEDIEKASNYIRTI